MQKNLRYISLLLICLWAYRPIAYSQINNPATCCDYTPWKHYQLIQFKNENGNASVAGAPHIFYINTQALIAAGKLQANGNDLRFLDSPCGNPLPFCIESGINTTQTEIWISLPSIASGATLDIYMYYDNAAAPSGTNCNAFFSTSLTISSNQTLSGVQNYDRITVNAGVTVSLNPQQPLVFNGKKINILGNIDGNGKGYGPASGPPGPPAGLGLGGDGFSTIGGGGGGYGNFGGRGGISTPSNAGQPYGTANANDIDMGSGGGGSECPASAAGGGAFTATGLVINVNGNISMNGQNATGCNDPQKESEGGGSGGGVLLQGIYINGTGTITCKGGNGASSVNVEGGGGGSGGRVKRFYTVSNGPGLGIDVGFGNAGTGGQPNMTNGQTGTNVSLQTPGIATTISGTEFQVSPVPVADFTTPGGICENSAAAFVDNSTVSLGSIQSYDWDFGSLTIHSGLQNPVINVTNCGQITVTLTVNTDGGCMASTSRILDVTGLPDLTVTQSSPCEGAPVVFDETVFFTGGCTDTYSVSYDFGDGSPVQNGSDLSHTYASAGQQNYSVTATTPSGCSVTRTGTATVYANPTVSFTTSTTGGIGQCPNSLISFQSTSTVPTPSTIANYTWDFGDGTNPFGTGQITSHPYLASGTYNVTLSVVTIESCPGSVTQPLTIYPNPIPSFIYDTSCIGTPTNFYNTTPTDPAMTFRWQINPPGGLYTTANASHTFSSNTNCTAVLTIVDGNQCSASYSESIYVQPLPVANFTTPVPICDPQDNAIFTNTTIPAIGTTQTWSFGDGTFSVAHDPVHNYLGPGTFTVTLDVVAGLCTSTVTKDVVVSEKPTASFTVSSLDLCQGTPITFIDNSTNPNDVITLREWDFGEPPIATVQDPVYNPVHAYIGSKPDTGFMVRLIVENFSQCKDTMIQEVKIYPLPIASFTSPDVCDKVPMIFESTSTISYGSINSYLFDFGDNTTFSGDSTSHLYPAAGTYATTLTVISDQGCIGMANTPVEVNPIPQADFVMDDDEGCDVHTVRFSSGSSPINPPHQIIDYFWDFSNGNTSDDLAPGPEDFPTGLYDITLIVKSIDGCIDTLVAADAVTVHPLPTADFSTDKETVGILNPSVIIVNESLGWNSCTIDYGDGNTDNLNDLIEHIYNDTGMYHLFLTAVTEFGCLDTISRYVHVVPDFAWYIPNAFTPNHDLKNEIWGGKGMAIKTYELQIFNRWGEEIFRSKNPEETWDGSVRDFKNSSEGKMIKQDIYVYKVNILDNNDMRHIYTGKLYVYPDTEKKLTK
ncbi:MAG: DUF2341 domain-containing protein [Bacteroidia bacterium]|nr:DUF2341 domain-containing protein [Bacteroidia bacterium]